MTGRTARVVLLTILAALVAVTGCAPQVPGTPTLPPIQPPLADTSWSLESWGRPGDMQAALPNTEVSLIFAGDSEVSGSAGCNVYGGTYTSSLGGTVSFLDLVQTEMYCLDPGVMDQEVYFMDTLRFAEQYAYVEGALHISGDGRLLILSRV
jgi:heat shock protein HslJ